ncbi:MAG: helix-turn-helix transcriptional regulator [Caulobacterales bacterium]
MNPDEGQSLTPTGEANRREERTWSELWFALDDAARLVVERDLTVRAASHGAQALIQGSPDLQLRDGALAARDRRTAADLAAAVVDASLQRRLHVIGAGDPGAFLIEVFALDGAADAPVALTLRDLSKVVDVESADLEAVFGVTPGEHQVIIRLLQGYSSRDIADQFGKSILTIRTHVKRAYGKIGVKSRGQLFARLLPYLWIR